MNRGRSFDEDLSLNLQDLEYAQEFILILMENNGDDPGLSLEQALKHTIQRMGIKEYSKLARIPAPHVSAFIKGRRKLKPETLDRFLKPFRLKVKIDVEKVA
jgi:predicted transcriptional regulator